MKSLTCPYCHAQIEMTWKRYWCSATIRYWFPVCSKRSRLVAEPRWIQYTSWVVQLLPIVGMYMLDFAAPALALLILYIPIFIFDKKLDERYGMLRALEWRPGAAVGQFDSRWRAPIGELNVHTKFKHLHLLAPISVA